MILKKLYKYHIIKEYTGAMSGKIKKFAKAGGLKEVRRNLRKAKKEIKLWETQ